MAHLLTDRLLIFPNAQDVVPTPHTDTETWKNLIADVSPRNEAESQRLADGASYMVCAPGMHDWIIFHQIPPPKHAHKHKSMHSA
jgi:hypothetical protein